MPLDPAAKNVLDLLAAAGGTPLHESTPDEGRASFAGLKLLSGEGAAVASCTASNYAGVPGITVTPEGDGPFPVMVWIHGGGWVIGDLESHAHDGDAVVAVPALGFRGARRNDRCGA